MAVQAGYGADRSLYKGILAAGVSFLTDEEWSGKFRCTGFRLYGEYWRPQPFVRG